MAEIRLSALLAPVFYPVHKQIRENRYTHFYLKGGRGSGKSSFASLEVIWGMMRNPGTSAVVLRKVGRTLKDSVFEQLLWAIEKLGADLYWEKKLCPLQLIYKPTGQKILFRGADEPRKIKSTKVKNGYIRYIWYEEADEFGGPEEFRIINQSLMRGGEQFTVLYTFNPPKSKRHWINQELNGAQEGRLVHQSDYRDVPREWLGEPFFLEAEHLKKTRPEAYANEYLGEAVGEGGEVFRNLTLRPITDEEIAEFDHIARGIDWGYAADPFCYVENHFDAARRRLYITFEIYKTNLSNRRAAELIRKHDESGGLITCDSAEPKSIAEMIDYGLRVVGAKKGPDSVEYGIKWLQDLEEIVIDPARCENAAREFVSYCLEKDKNGNFQGRYPDRDNHTIDAVRYSREMDMRRVKVR